MLSAKVDMMVSSYSGKSVVYRKYKSGPGTLPGNTPANIDFVRELASPLDVE